MSRIVILGGGFAGVTAAEVLSAGAAAEYEISIVSANRRLTFFPALVPLVFGDFVPDEVRADMVPKLHQRQVRFIEGEVLEIDPVLRTVRITGDDLDGELHFDHLLIAVGRRLATEKIPGFFEHAHHLLGVDAAIRFKHAIAEFNAGSIVVGLCPESFLPIPVCESALALAERFKREITEKTVTITAVFPETLEHALDGSGLFRDIEGALQRRGVKLVQNFPIERVEDRNLFAESAPSIPFDLLMLIPPFRGQAAIQGLFSDENTDGFAKVNGLMQVEGYKGIYAAGDIISLPGPRFGYMAIRQAKVAATNILVELSGENPVVEYIHELSWILGEEYTHPHFFHYGVWDETLYDFDENALLGMTKRIRERYGRVRSGNSSDAEAATAGKVSK